MNNKVRIMLGASFVALAMTAQAWAQTATAKNSSTFYTQTNLVSSSKGLKAKIHDKNLINPWGLVQGPTPFWVSDNNAGVSTLYDGTGKIVKTPVNKKNVPFVVTIPPPGSTGTAAPSGIVFNNVSTDFTGDLFIFSAEDGTISGWQPADAADGVLHVDNSAIPTSATGAVYKGLAIATVSGNQFIYATNFRSGKVDVFDGGYNRASLTGNFTDPSAMTGFAPFGITLFGGSHLWVSYAMQDAAMHDPVHQAGAGYVDIFSTDGVFESRFATGGNLNAPWGMALTPANFGPLSNDFWIGNFGDGMINAFDSMGNPVGQPMDKKGKPLNVDGLWALVFGNGSDKASPNALYFTAGPNSETEGIFGTFQFKPKRPSGMPGGY